MRLAGILIQQRQQLFMLIDEAILLVGMMFQELLAMTFALSRRATRNSLLNLLPFAPSVNDRCLLEQTMFIG